MSSVLEYKAIVFDLDGTAVPNQPGGMPSQRLIDTIAKYQNQIHLIAATGRPILHAKPVLNALHLITPAIVSGGTIILAPTTYDILKFTPLPAAAVHTIVDLVKNTPYGLTLRDETVDTSAISTHPTLADTIEIAYIGRVPGADMPAMTEALKAIPGIAASAVPDWLTDGYAFNITHIDATKEHAVAEVLETLGVPAAATIGVGDGNNDLHLFRSVGLKVAMGNASPDLKAAADIVCPTVDEDGLSQIIEQYAPRA